jgi:MFS family permease
VFGAAAMISSLGMALGPAVGGWIFDTFHGYGYLYIASFGMGLAAVAIALAFPGTVHGPTEPAIAAGVILRRRCNGAAFIRVDPAIEPGECDENGPACPVRSRGCR